MMQQQSLNYCKDEAVISYSASKEVLFCFIFFFLGLALLGLGFVPSEAVGISHENLVIGWVVFKYFAALVGFFLTLHMLRRFIRVDTNLESSIDLDKLGKLHTLIQGDPEFVKYVTPLLDKLNSKKPITNRNFYHYNIDRFYEEYIQNSASKKMKEFVDDKPIADTAIAEAYLELIKANYDHLLKPQEVVSEKVKTSEEYHADFGTIGFTFIFRWLVQAFSFAIGWALYLISMLFVAICAFATITPFVPSFLLGSFDRVSVGELDRVLHVAKYDLVVFKYLQDVVKEGRLLIDSDLSTLNLNLRESLLKTIEIQIYL